MLQRPFLNDSRGAGIHADKGGIMGGLKDEEHKVFSL